MGRAKIQIKKIEKLSSRKVTFAKRKVGFINKAFELATLCDADVACILFSPSGKLTMFCRDNIDQVISRYYNTSEDERMKSNVENAEFLNKEAQKAQKLREECGRLESKLAESMRLESEFRTSVVEEQSEFKTSVAAEQSFDERTSSFQDQTDFNNLLDPQVYEENQLHMLPDFQMKEDVGFCLETSDPIENFNNLDPQVYDENQSHMLPDFQIKEDMGYCLEMSDPIENFPSFQGEVEFNNHDQGVGVCPETRGWTESLSSFQGQVEFNNHYSDQQYMQPENIILPPLNQDGSQGPSASHGNQSTPDEQSFDPWLISFSELIRRD